MPRLLSYAQPLPVNRTPRSRPHYLRDTVPERVAPTSLFVDLARGRLFVGPWVASARAHGILRLLVGSGRRVSTLRAGALAHAPCFASLRRAITQCVKLLTVVLISFVAFVIAMLVFLRFRAVAWIHPAQARLLLEEEDATLLDVRSADEFAAGHIEGAVNIPIDELHARWGELGNKRKPVVVYCVSGARSSRAKRGLESDGFRSVHNLGSIQRWD